MAILNLASKALLIRCLRLSTVLMLFIATATVSIATAMADRPLEYPVKGAYLFKFGDFIEWPTHSFPEAGSPFIIGILGEDPFGPELDEMVQSRTVQGRQVIVKRYKILDDAKAAHILYIGANKAERLEQIQTSLNGKSVLTVSDESKEAAGIVNFTVLDNKVRFEIDPAAALRASLKVSSKLLSVAIIVRNEKR
ncbi:MAG TPA: YfiR family protein [Burkholderiales bacterium]|nr:YfiR family protein [Burkholderiales bacterium]